MNVVSIGMMPFITYEVPQEYQQLFYRNRILEGGYCLTLSNLLGNTPHGGIRDIIV